PFDDCCARTEGPRMVTSSVLVFMSVFLERVHCHGSLPVYRRHSELDMDPPAHDVYGSMPIGVVTGICDALVINGQVDAAVHERAVVNLIGLLARVVVGLPAPRNPPGPPG